MNYIISQQSISLDIYDSEIEYILIFKYLKPNHDSVSLFRELFTGFSIEIGRKTSRLESCMVLTSCPSMYSEIEYILRMGNQIVKPKAFDF